MIKEYMLISFVRSLFKFFLSFSLLSFLTLFLFANFAHAQGSRVYVSNSLDNTVSVIDGGTNNVITTIPVGTQPEGLVVTPDGTKVYVANLLDNSVSVIDESSNSVIATVPVGVHPGQNNIGVDPSGLHVYVPNYLGGSVSVINTNTNLVEATIQVG